MRRRSRPGPASMAAVDPTLDLKNPSRLVRCQILAECEVMVTYALASGQRVPPSLLQTVGESGIEAPESAAVPVSPAVWRSLAQAHDQLCHLVSPATPRTLLLLRQERVRGGSTMLGPVPLIRRLTVAAIALLALFLLTAISPDVNAVSGDIFNSSGLKLAVNEVFLLSAAGIGAAFAALFTASRYIARGTYDPKYESTYWIRFVLGLLAGIVLASLIPVKVGSGAHGNFTRPFLALLGGFSAAVVFRILTRMVATLESLFQGDLRDSADATRRQIIAEVTQRTALEQLHLSSALVQLREQLAAGVPNDRLMATLSGILDDVIPAAPGQEPHSHQTPPGADGAGGPDASHEHDPPPEPDPPPDPSPSANSREALV